MFQGKDAEAVAHAILLINQLQKIIQTNKPNKLNSTSPITNFNVSAATGSGDYFGH